MPDSNTSVAVAGRRVELVCHMAVLSGRHRRNSIEAIRECFEAGVGRIELDVHSIAEQDYVVYHDRRLESETTGRGSVGLASADEIRGLRFTEEQESRPPLLSEVVKLARGCGTEMQLDWKDLRLLSAERLRALMDTVAPMRDRVIVSTGQDWNLRRLHAADPTFPFGFDPGHYLGFDTTRWLGPDAPASPLPRSPGAYGYADDHPLALARGEATIDYLAERMETLTLQAPGAREYFLSYRLVLQMLDDGFNVADWLHERGIGANVWTLDYGGDESVAWLRRLIESGIDRITTNTAPAWMRALTEG